MLEFVEQKRLHLPNEYRELINLFMNQNWVLPFKNNETEIYTSGYEFFPSLLMEIGKAEHHIHLDTFIIASDPLGQIVADALIDNGSISSEDLANQTREVENAWYQVLALDLPSEMSPEELKEVEESRNRALLNQQNLQIKKKVQEASLIC